MAKTKLGTDALSAHDMAVAMDIAGVLGETDEQPQLQIGLVVKTVGENTARTFLAEAQEIETAGGMLFPDGKRRTFGGVFFQVVRKNTKGKSRQIIFYHWRNPPQPGEPGAAPAGLPSMKWTERGTILNEAVAGKATNVKVTIVGRPGKVVVREGFAFISLSNEGGAPSSLPKGVPVPQKLPRTQYALYIGLKQWRNNVAPYLRRDATDELIAEGTGFYDTEFGVIAVLVNSATTKGREQERRKQQLAPQNKEQNAAQNAEQDAT